MVENALASRTVDDLPDGANGASGPLAMFQVERLAEEPLPDFKFVVASHERHRQAVRTAVWVECHEPRRKKGPSG